jgi:FimV-like protein
LQNEPELDILQNIADKLPAQADVEVQESDAMGKLDLARAYIEIDEFSDAKALLNEVIKLGTKTESAEAKQLLQQLNEI